MKKIILCGILLTSIFVYAKDLSGRKVMFFAGAIGSVTAYDVTIQNHMPIDYTQYFSQNPALRTHCTSAICDDGAIGLGGGLELGVKFRIIPLVEIDAYAGGTFGTSHTDEQIFPNSMILHDTIRTNYYEKNNSYYFNINANVDATIRLGSFGIIGGIGIGYWSQTYEAELVDVYGGKYDYRNSSNLETSVGAITTHVNVGLSYMIRNFEIILRASIPVYVRNNTESRAGNNGFVDYNETLTFKAPYNFQIIARILL